jgi:hypothetical protein
VPSVNDNTSAMAKSHAIKSSAAEAPPATNRHIAGLSDAAEIIGAKRA